MQVIKPTNLSMLGALPLGDVTMLTLRIQAFLAFLGFAALLLLGVYTYSSMSFEKSFETYTLQRENERNAELIESLKQHYEEEGSFKDFQTHPKLWDAINQLRRNGERFPARPQPTSDQANLILDHRPASRGPRREFRTRYLLLDEHKNLIAGNRSNRDQYLSTEIALEHNGKKNVIGYLSMPVNRALRDLADLQFVAQQKDHFSRMTVFALIAAFAFAIPFALLLTRKLKRITEHVESLSHGLYEHRIKVNGRDEISTLAQQLNHLGQTLQESEQSRKRFVADISHELRTPLAVLKADLEALQDGVRPLTHDAIARLQSHTDRLQHLINDLYELSLTDVGAMTYRKTSCDLVAIVKASLERAPANIVDRGLTLTSALPEHSVIIFADEARIHQLLENLLANSAQYTHAPGQIQLTLDVHINRAVIMLEDSAPSVNHEELQKIFERLYRSDSSRNRQTGGAGLGLSICRNIISAHEGSISASISDLGGLKIIVEIPLVIG